MQPLADYPINSLQNIRYVLTDIDDTITEKGRLPAASYHALEKLQQAGLKVIPITGRPAGWCDHIARMWPVDGVVGENGAFYFAYDHSLRNMTRRFWKSENEREADREKLQHLRGKILVEVEGAATASDQAYRESDLAIDFCEDVPALPQSSVDQIVQLFEQHGAVAKVSSIHVNGWFGNYDKLSMTRIFLKEYYQVEMDSVREQIIFSGDSPNDLPMFEYFPNSVGVANVTEFASEMRTLPRWVTQNKAAGGFVEIADAIIRARCNTVKSTDDF